MPNGRGAWRPSPKRQGRFAETTFVPTQLAERALPLVYSILPFPLYIQNMPQRGHEQIYSQPDDYDLEHSKPEGDIGFFTHLIKRLRPRRVMELACGNGRITIPVGIALSEWGGEIIGLDNSDDMLTAGKAKAEAFGDLAITWQKGDMRSWHTGQGLDLILCPCSSMSHLLELKDHLAAWKCAYDNLASQGRFVVAEQMANLPTLAESQCVPPRISVELDSDTVRDNGSEAERLVRYRATRYYANQQRARIRFLYDKVRDQSSVAERFISDYECHVFYPRELTLLFLASGFSVEQTWGDYRGGAFTEGSREMIVSGRKA